MNPEQLTQLKLEGYKSIKECDLQLRDLNVIIGPNGAGKSNLIGLFKLIQQLLEGNLQRHISKNGGPDAFLHFGRKKTKQFAAELYFGNNGYKFALEPTADNRMMFVKEALWWNQWGDWRDGWSGHFETKSETAKGSTAIYGYTIPVMKKWRVYHFHDTGENAAVKSAAKLNDNEYLRNDAANLPSFLYLLKNKYPENYDHIVKTVRLVAPYFGDFNLRPDPLAPDQIELEWFEPGEDMPFKAYHLSDGTLRFICLATVLLQPAAFQPETIVVDEPELGLHPFAIRTLAGLFRTISKTKQILVSTQSVSLLNEFMPEDVIVCDRQGGASRLRRIAPGELTEWLKEYSLGELWEKNILGGRPAR